MKEISKGLKVFLIIFVLLIAICNTPSIEYGHLFSEWNPAGSSMRYCSMGLLSHLFPRTDLADVSFSIFEEATIPYYIAITILFILMLINKKQRNIIILFIIVICMVISMHVVMHIMNNNIYRNIVLSIKNNNSNFYNYIKLDNQQDDIYIITAKDTIENSLFNPELSHSIHVVKIIDEKKYSHSIWNQIVENEDEYIVVVDSKTQYRIPKEIFQK